MVLVELDKVTTIMCMWCYHYHNPTNSEFPKVSKAVYSYSDQTWQHHVIAATEAMVECKASTVRSLPSIEVNLTTVGG